MRTQQDLAQIVALGAGLDLQSGTMPQRDLAQLASLAATHGGTLILRGMQNRPQQDLAQLAALGKGKAIIGFD
jgi:hypothetical protein